MKYQIYLDKETSDFINGASEQEGIRPATAIKRIVESIVRVTIATKQATEKELQNVKKR